MSFKMNWEFYMLIGSNFDMYIYVYVNINKIKIQ